MANDFTLRPMRADEHALVAEVIYQSIRQWYGTHGRPGRFPAGAAACTIYPQVYEDLDPGSCLVAEDHATGRLAGSCFYHPRPTHVSLGIMNAHPDYFGRGVARSLLQQVCDFADREAKPLRLVSSAMNLDSFSLYTRAGFTPRAVFHDMTVHVPDQGFPPAFAGQSLQDVRPARPGDAAAMAQLEWELTGIRREQDYRYIIENKRGIWHTSVAQSAPGVIDGFLVSVQHPAANMLGPGAMRTEDVASALILTELNHNRGRSPVLVVPAASGRLVNTLYAWGVRNCEIHLFQARGQAASFQGVVMPTFFPETG